MLIDINEEEAKILDNTLTSYKDNIMVPQEYRKEADELLHRIEFILEAIATKDKMLACKHRLDSITKELLREKF